MGRRIAWMGVTLLGLALSGAVLLSQNKIVETSAYSSTALPSTIDLNDSSESTIRSYYSGLSSLSTSERQGENLLKNLKPILKNGQKYLNYDSGSAIWQMYEIVDRDWEKSPASSTTYGTYNPSTNKIIDYVYGTSSSDKRNNPYIHALYINRDVENLTDAWSDHQQTQWGINREHIWAKANGFNSEGAGGARGDPMHLWAGNGKVNGASHAQLSFAFVDKTKSYEDAGTRYYSNLSGNLRGKSATFPSSSNEVFEPQDCDKGDIARAVFYMAARYNYISGSDSDGIDCNNPNLKLVQDVAYAATGYNSSTTKAGTLGVISDLLEWNRSDPPDQWEIHRNNLLYVNYTNNRNPFIDFPQWAEYVWGSANYNGRKFVSYDDTPTGYAIPASDTLNGFSEVVLNPITLDKYHLNLLSNGSSTITATSSSSVSWSSSDDSVAMVSPTSGSTVTITGKSEGDARITASVIVNEKVYHAYCDVSVFAEPSVTLNKTVEDMVVGGKSELIATSSDDSTISWSSSDSTVASLSVSSSTSGGEVKVTALREGSATITASATIGGNVYSGTCAIHVTSAPSDSLTDTLTSSLLALSGKGYVDWNGKTDSTGAVYAGNSCYNKTYIQLRNNSPSGIVCTSSNNKVLNVTVFWNSTTQNGRTLQIFGKKSAFELSSDLYKESTKGTLLGEIVYGTSTSLDISGDYSYIGMISGAGTIYLDAINITYQGVTSIEASTKSDVYYAGYTLTASDLTVRDNLGNEIDDFEFDDHLITFEEASEVGMEPSTITLPVIYNDLKCEVEVVCTREGYDPRVTDVLNRATTGISGTTYTNWSGKTVSSSATYAGQSAGGNESIQIRSENSNSGIITTASGGFIRKIQVEWNSNTNNDRTLNIYGKNTAYSSPADLFDNSKRGTVLGTIVYGTSTELTVQGDYAYIGLRSKSGALYLTSVSITYELCLEDSLSNLIMESDTENQCLTKFDECAAKFANMPKANRVTFMTSEDYVIASARTRLEAWARSLGKEISPVNDDYQILNSAKDLSSPDLVLNEKTSLYGVTLVLGTTCVLGGILLVGRISIKRKEQ